LTGPALASIEKHVSSCEVCTAEARALRDVSRALAALPVDEPDALSVRRQRQRLLASFNEAMVAPATSFSKRRWTGVGTLVGSALVVIAVLSTFRGHRAAPIAASENATGPADDVVVIAPEPARWSRADHGPETRLELDDGELDVHVKHHGDPHGLLVKLPDGELRDIGTTFRVRVREGRTVSVVVREGAVVFRRDGASPVLVGAGESWSADDSSLRVAAPESASSRSPALVPATPSSTHRTAALPPAAPAAGDTDKEFREGVDLLNAGDAAPAAASLRAYLARAPSAARAEDASYLLVLALHRAGDDPAALAAAREYVRLYPNGLRRREVERLFPGKDR
jgi:hypothetical protein